jgi:hypothetical protein
MPPQSAPKAWRSRQLRRPRPTRGTRLCPVPSSAPARSHLNPPHGAATLSAKRKLPQSISHQPSRPRMLTESRPPTCQGETKRTTAESLCTELSGSTVGRPWNKQTSSRAGSTIRRAALHLGRFGTFGTVLIRGDIACESSPRLPHQPNPQRPQFDQHLSHDPPTTFTQWQVIPKRCVPATKTRESNCLTPRDGP